MTTTFSACGVKEAEETAIWNEASGEIEMEGGNELEGYLCTLLKAPWNKDGKKFQPKFLHIPDQLQPGSYLAFNHSEGTLWSQLCSHQGTRSQ